jgi:hypothetical protein
LFVALLAFPAARVYENRMDIAGGAGAVFSWLLGEPTPAGNCPDAIFFCTFSKIAAAVAPHAAKLAPLLPLLILGLYVLLVLKPLHHAATSLFTRGHVEQKADEHHSRLDSFVSTANVTLLLGMGVVLAAYSLPGGADMVDAAYGKAANFGAWVSDEADNVSGGRVRALVNFDAVPEYVNDAWARVEDLAAPYFDQDTIGADLKNIWDKLGRWLKENTVEAAGASPSNAVLIALGWDATPDTGSVSYPELRAAVARAVDEGLPLAVGVVLLLHGDVELPRLVFLAGGWPFHPWRTRNPAPTATIACLRLSDGSLVATCLRLAAMQAG